MSGLIVGVVALSLSMALAIASGVPPQHGLYTAIIAEGLIGILGGSSVQISGPTAAFVVILAPISAKFGIGGLMVATMMAGALLVAAGLARFGRLIEFIPYPVTTGFTSGIAVVIATLQVRDFFGLKISHMPESYIQKVTAIATAMPSLNVGDFSIGLLTLAILVLLPKISKLAATGAIARTATNVRCGGRSPVAAVTHSVFILVAVMVIAPLLGYLPMASMAAMLLIVAWNTNRLDISKQRVEFALIALRPSPRVDRATPELCRPPCR